MLTQTKHKTVMINILKGIYSDPYLRSILGFKGGTAGYLFYNLPRFSVDLDFNLLDIKREEEVFAKLERLIAGFGKLYDARKKRYTLFFLLNYKKGERNLKIEISRRSEGSKYELKNYLGIAMLVMRKEDMAAGKLSAILTRKKFAARDLFDLWFFLKEGWDISKSIVKEKTGKGLEEAIAGVIKKVEAVGQRQLLQGVGELLEEEEKNWVRKKLREELLFQLRLYQETHLDLTKGL
jgi:predicted nucleotidyltransferase component of viral defense system